MIYQRKKLIVQKPKKNGEKKLIITSEKENSKAYKELLALMESYISDDESI